MNERDLPPAARAILPDAVEKVAGLYQGEVFGEAFGVLNQQERNHRWKQSAEDFPPFKNKIIGLRLALNNARQAYDTADMVLRDVVESRFEPAEDMGARHLLSTILCSRATKDLGVIDEKIFLDIEAQAMKKELGLMPGIKGLELETMGLNRVIEAVLTGELKLSRQTQINS